MQKNWFWSTWDIRHAERLQLGSNRTDPSKEHWKQPAIMRIRPGDTTVTEFPGTCASTCNSPKHFFVRFIQSLVSGDSLQNIKTSWDPAIGSIHIFGHGHRSHLNIGKCKMQVHFVWNHFCLKIPQWETSSKYNISIATDQLQMICCDHSWRQEKEGNHRYPPRKWPEIKKRVKIWGASLHVGNFFVRINVGEKVQILELPSLGGGQFPPLRDSQGLASTPGQMPPFQGS